jgi:signal transduction histidine kinase
MSPCHAMDASALAVLAHELRHPLAPIRSAVEVIRRVDSQEPRIERAVGIIDRQLGLLTRLIDRLFDGVPVGTAPMPLQLEVLDLAEVLEQALEVCQPPLARHSVTINWPTVPALIEGDRLRLVQVLTNLLDNAAKYSEAPGHIEVELSVNAEMVWVQVRDQGRGIAAEYLPHIFDLFVQGQAALAVPGFGIGLAVVKRLVEAHGGQIEVHSAGLGQGAAFRVSLPRRYSPHFAK